MTLDDTTRAAAADALWQAGATRQGIDPLSSTWPDLDVVDAYEIQLLNIARRLADGAVVRGHKVGLSAKAMQQMLGVHEPDYGHLLDDMALDERQTVPLKYCQPRVEVEVGFVLGADLPGAGCTEDDVLRATSALAPAIESA